MEKRIKLGIVLIIVAVCIGGFFIWQYFQGKQNAAVPQAEIEKSVDSVSSSSVTVTESPTATKESVPDPSIDESKESMTVDINPDMLNFMGITKEEMEKELRIYANSCGYAAVEKVKDIDELIINYAKKTITIPCYFALKKNISKFDLIYQYEKKQYRFVPW